MADDLTFGAHENPADCFRAIAGVLESGKPLGRAELTAILPLIELAYRNLDDLRIHAANLVGCFGVRLTGSRIIFAEPAAPPSPPPPPDLPPEAFRR